MSESKVRVFLSDVKVAFMMSNPFFYFLLNSMEVVYIDDVSEVLDGKGERLASAPVAVEGLKIIFFKNALEDGVVKKFPIPIIKHEMLHVALEHCVRGVDIMRNLITKHNLVPTEDNMGKVHFMVNLAMDAKVNHLLVKDGDSVSWGFTGEGFWSNDDIDMCSVEEMVDKIFDKDVSNRVRGFGAGVDILKFTDEDCVDSGVVIQKSDGSFDGLKGRELLDKLKEKVVECVVKAKLAGVEKGGVLRELDNSILAHKNQQWWLKLRYLMRSQMVKSKISDWRVVNRKLPNQIAGLRLIKKPKCACFVDVSGSVSGKEYGIFVDEMLLASKESDVTAIFWDVGIQEIRKVHSKKDMVRPVRGGGGTVFKIVIESFDMRGYDIMVCLTDGFWFDTESAVEALKKIRVYKILCSSGQMVKGFDESIEIRVDV